MATSLAEIQSFYEFDDNFKHMRTPGTYYVGGEGSYNPKIMIVGEAPGKEENRTGIPFYGPAGRLLRRDLMEEANIPFDICYITNVVKYWPRDEGSTRKPTPLEVENSIPYLWMEWSALNRPEVIITVGAVATNVLAPNVQSSITKIAYNLILLDNFIVAPVVHPAYILRNMDTLPKHREGWAFLGDWLKDKEYI